MTLCVPPQPGPPFIPSCTSQCGNLANGVNGNARRNVLYSSSFHNVYKHGEPAERGESPDASRGEHNQLALNGSRRASLPDWLGMGGGGEGAGVRALNASAHRRTHKTHTLMYGDIHT